MLLKFSIILFLACTLFAANVVGKDHKRVSTQKGEAEEQSPGNYGEYEEHYRKVRQLPYYYDESNQNSYSQSGQYYDNGQQNPNQYDPYGQDSNGYGQYPQKRPGYKPVSIGNGRGNTNVVSINGNGEPYAIGYSSQGGAFEYDQYGNRKDIPSYPQGSKGNNNNNVVLVRERGSNSDTVLLTSQSKNGQRSSILVNQDGAILSSGSSRKPYNTRGSYNQQNGYGQSQDYGYY